jgi:hypothetical protein
MSFISTFEELSKLYESKEVNTEEEKNEVEVENAEDENLTEAAAVNITDDANTSDDTNTSDEKNAVDDNLSEATDEEAVKEEPRSVILECANCGALVIRDEAEVVIDEEADLANMEEACQYCEEAAGYKIVGVVAPYEAEEAVEVVEDSIEDEEVVV